MLGLKWKSWGLNPVWYMNLSSSTTTGVSSTVSSQHFISKPPWVRQSWTVKVCLNFCYHLNGSYSWNNLVNDRGVFPLNGMALSYQRLNKSLFPLLLNSFPKLPLFSTLPPAPNSKIRTQGLKPEDLHCSLFLTGSLASHLTFLNWTCTFLKVWISSSTS